MPHLVPRPYRLRGAGGDGGDGTLNVDPLSDVPLSSLQVFAAFPE